GSAVIRLPTVADQARYGGQCDDPSGLATSHHRHDHRMDYVVERVQIGMDHAIPFVASHGGKGRIASDACVADDTVVGAVRVDIGAQVACGRSPVGDVEGQDASAASERANRLGSL